MLTRKSALLVMAAVAFGCGGDSEQAEPADEAPATMEAAAPEAAEAAQGEITEAMIEEGRTLYAGAGLCAACHGPNAGGIPNLGTNLTDDEWLHGDGTYESIVDQIMMGVSADQSSTGTVMPPKGGSAITDAQVRAVAAYVYSLSN
ncbi:MAG: c-type cytochrome [Gemmatimonadales bacterium]